MQPRWYQTEAVDAWWRYFHHHNGNPLIAMPTGTGKSVVIAMLLQSIFAAYPGTRVLMLTHVSELIRQNLSKLLAMWPSAPVGVYAAGLDRRDVHLPITFASIQSVYKLADTFGWVDLVFIDEAHIVSNHDATMYLHFLKRLKQRNSRLKITGLSATCYRMGMGMLTDGGIFSSICYDITTPEMFARLIAEGYMCRLDAMPTGAEFNTDDVKTTAGEFNAKELAGVVDVEEKTRRVLTELVGLAQANNCHRWLLFGVNVAHVDHIAAILSQEFGIGAAVVHSKQKEAANEKELRDFKLGVKSVAVSMNSLTTGVDVPEIDFIGMMRPTKSTSLWVQMLGRGTRPAPGKTRCLVGDFTSNTRRLGPIDQPLLPRKKGAKKLDQSAMPVPVKICPKCGIYVHASKTVCPNCGNTMERSVKLEMHAEGLPVMSLETPKVDRHEVHTITYHFHRPKDQSKPPSMMVAYHCGIRRFSEYICIEHPEGSPPHRRALDWWAARFKHSPMWLPTSAQMAVDATQYDALKKPTHIDVWMNRQYPEIVGHVFP